MIARRWVALVAVAALTALLVSCGGAGVGGGGGDSGNLPPNVSTNLALSAVTGEEVVFTADASDPEGQGLTFTWGFTSWPWADDPDSTDPPPTIDNLDPGSPDASYTFSVPGSYELELVVSDGDRRVTISGITVDVELAPLDTPILRAPDDRQTGVGIPVTLDWDDVPDADSYRVYLDTDSLREGAIEIDAGSSSSYTLSDLQNGTQYWWWVEARHDQLEPNETGSIGGPRSFTTVVALPGDFSITAPAGESPVVVLPLTVTWEESPGATSYEVTIATGARLPTVVANQTFGAGTRSWTLPIGEENGGLSYSSFYTVTIVASNSGGSTPMSSPATQSFATAEEPPEVPSEPSPRNGSTGVPLGLEALGWADSPRADSYEITLVDEDERKLVDDTTNVASYGLAQVALVPGVTYSWQVVAVGDGGRTAGSTWVFTTEAADTSTGLVGEWLFTDWVNNGNPEKDSSPRGYDGIGLPRPSLKSGAIPPQPVLDRYGEEISARSFNGSNQYVQVPSQVNEFQMDAFENGLSVSFWFFTTEGLTNGEPLISKTDGQTGFEIRAGVSRSGTPDLLMMLYGNPGVAIPAERIAPGVWNHVVFVWDPKAGEVAGWINGENAVNTLIKSFTNGWAMFLMGRGVNGYFGGYLDDVRVYNRPLSSPDVWALHNE